MKNMKSFIVVMMVVLVAACSPDKKTLAEASTSPDEDDQFQSFTSPLYIQLGTRWELDTTGPFEVASTNICKIPAMASSPATATCTFKVPEAKLYYSNLKFLVGTTMASVCPLLFFHPYYYRRSANAAFKPPGFTVSVNCSGTAGAKNKLCYGGAAPSILDDFPDNTGRYFNTNILSEQSFSLASANSIRWYGSSRVSYLAASDNSTPASIVNGDVDDARTGEWYGYNVSCQDMWGETLYNIDITIEDENWDPNSTGNDDFTDWQ
jgi:hypothetical protein